jgi:poly(A) polymerase
MDRSYRSLQDFLHQVVPLSPFASKVYLVGGFVRDQLLGIESKDMDAVVEAPGGAEAFAKFLQGRYPDSISNPHCLGAGYPIWQVVFKTDIVENGVVFFLRGCELEIADTQKEMFPESSTRNRITSFGTLAEDCARRDFCCNMLYLDLTTQKILDPSGKGFEDIQTGSLSGHPAVSMEKIFSDDPLRILRLIRFHCRFKWRIDPRCLLAIEPTKERLKILSEERVRDEIIKMAESGHFELGLELIRRTGVLEILFPQLVPMVGCTQDNIYHSEGDVWVHTLLVVKNAEKSLLQQLTALLHDVGKPVTRSEVGLRVKFLGHEKESSRMATEFLNHWKFSQPLRNNVVKLVDLHLRGSDVQNWKGVRAARKLLRDAGDLINELLMFIEADSMSSLGPDGSPRLEHLPMLKEQLVKAQLIPIRTQPLLDGLSIMELLNIPGGPQIKLVQLFVLELEDLFAERGETLDVPAAKEAVLNRFAKILS